MKINMRLSFVGLVVAAIAIFAGWVLLGGVGELADRTEQAVAVYEDSRLTYTTQAGQAVTIPAWTECKNFSRLTDECIGYYANGDEVLVTFDSAEPSRPRGGVRRRVDSWRPGFSGAASRWGYSPCCGSGSRRRSTGGSVVRR